MVYLHHAGHYITLIVSGNRATKQHFTREIKQWMEAAFLIARGNLFNSVRVAKTKDLSTNDFSLKEDGLLKCCWNFALVWYPVQVRVSASSAKIVDLCVYGELAIQHNSQALAWIGGWGYFLFNYAAEYFLCNCLLNMTSVGILFCRNLSLF